MDVAEYLQITEFGTEELVQWGEMTLCVRASDTMVLPPPPAVASVRGMLLRASKVMVVEALTASICCRAAAVRRAKATRRPCVAKCSETGYEVAELERIGVLHYEHRTPDPGGWASQHYPLLPGDLRMRRRVRVVEARPTRLQPSSATGPISRS